MNATYELQKELLETSNLILGIKEYKRELTTIDQLEKLKKLGFNDIKLKTNKLMFKYPNMKIIHSKAIDTICEKYNLINGPIDRFIGDIPKKNADEILRNADFIKRKIKEETFQIKEEVYNYGYYNYYNLEKSEFIKKYGQENYEELIKNEQISIKKGFFSSRKYFKVEYDVPEIRIIAPINEFDTKKMRIKGNKLKKIKSEDPIVIVKVDNKLWSVVSAWGPEAADANVFNEICN